MPMEQIGQDGGRGARADQPLGLERLHVGVAEALGLGVEQPSARPAQRYRAAAPASARWTAAAPKGRSACARRPAPRRARSSADHRCSLTSGVTVTPSRVRIAASHSAAQARSAGIIDARERLQGDGRERVIGQRAAEVVPIAAHGERGRPDRPAEIEGEDLGAGDSGGTAAPSAPAARICLRRSGRPSACGRRRRHGARTGTGSSLRSCAKKSGGAPRCSSRSGPAHTAESGIMCARLRVETGGWRTLA